VIEHPRQQAVRGASSPAAATETLVGVWLLPRIVPTVTVVWSDASDEEPSPALAPRFSQSATRRGEELAGQPSRSSYLRQTVSSGNKVMGPPGRGLPASEIRLATLPSSPLESPPCLREGGANRALRVQRSGGSRSYNPCWQGCRKSRTPPLRPVHRHSLRSCHGRCRAPGSRPRPGRCSAGSWASGQRLFKALSRIERAVAQAVRTPGRLNRRRRVGR